MKTMVVSFVAILSTSTALANTDLSPAQRQKLMDVLVSALKERGSWVSVHAAEALITIGNGEPARAAFAPQAESAEPPFRIGVWRILARSVATQGERDAYIERIRKVMLDPSATDRTHAFEALAKVKAPFVSDADKQSTVAVAESASNTAPFAAWRLAEFEKGDTHSIHRLAELLGSSDPICRARAAAALSTLQSNDPVVQSALESASKSETDDALDRPYVMGALNGHPLRALAETAQDPAVRAAAIGQLAHVGTTDDIDLLWKVFEDANEDVRVESAFALLRISGGPLSEPHP